MSSTTTDLAVDPALVLRLMAKRSFCTLSTTSAQQRPHVAGVLYAADGATLYVNTLRSSRKARNVAEVGRAAVCIPVRRLPVGPPSSIQFQGRAEVVAFDDPSLQPLLAAGALGAITSHGELELPDGCFLRLTPAGPVATFGLGLPLRRLLRDPLHAGGRADLRADLTADLKADRRAA